LPCRGCAAPANIGRIPEQMMEIPFVSPRRFCGAGFCFFDSYSPPLRSLCPVQRHMALEGAFNGELRFPLRMGLFEFQSYVSLSRWLIDPHKICGPALCRRLEGVALVSGGPSPMLFLFVSSEPSLKFLCLDFCVIFKRKAALESPSAE